MSPPGGVDDATGSLAVAANARLALLGGGQLLVTVSEPAASQALSDAVRQFGLALSDVGANALAGIPNSDPDQAERLRKAAELNSTIGQLCT
jgi:hypothetical protein